MPVISLSTSAPRYTEIAPDPSLAAWIQCYWTMQANDAPSVPNRVLPDGCADIIIGLADAPGPVAVGTMRTAEVFSLSGAVDYVGVRFNPGCALPFVGVPLHELTDCRVPLDALWGNDARVLADISSEERIPRLARALSERLSRWSHRRPDEPLATRAIALMRQARGGATIRAVASALGVGERRLERAFDRNVGVSPKVYARVMRLRRAVRRIDAACQSRSRIAWTALAFDAGYADQPHLIREFRELAGVTPVEFAAERPGVGFVQDDPAVTA